jgi:aconitate hydratase
LQDLWPEDHELDAALAHVQAEDFALAFREASSSAAWDSLDVANEARFPWNPRSTILRRPPFVSPTIGTRLGQYTAHPLLVLGDDVTTDHLSPASAIPPGSPAAEYLVAKGEDSHDLNVFASRRGNWEVMMRAAFYSRTLVNLLAPGVPVGQTVHAPSGDVMPIWQVAQRYRDAGDSVVLVAGERFGTGSSRDWAAKGQAVLGVRAVLARSFERIHRSNLIGMGILPLVLPAGRGPAQLTLHPGDRLEIDAPPASIVAGGIVPVTIIRLNGTREKLLTTAAVQTRQEVELLQRGGMLPAILEHSLT